PHLEKPDLGEITKEFLKKGIPLSKKVEVKATEGVVEHGRTAPGWQIDDVGLGRSYTIVPGRSALEGTTKSMTDGISASDLGNFGTKEWVRGLLKNPMDDHYFGLVKKDEVDADGKKVKVEGLTTMQQNWRAGIDKA